MFNRMLIAHLGKRLSLLTMGMLLCALAGDFCPLTAVTVTPEVPPQEEIAPREMTLEPAQETPEPADPFEELSKSPSSESTRRARETRTILIILAVLVLLSAYWLTSGRLHHRFPR